MSRFVTTYKKLRKAPALVRYTFDEIQPKEQVIKMGHFERCPSHDYHFAGDILKESIWERDFGVDTVPSLSPEHDLEIC